MGAVRPAGCCSFDSLDEKTFKSRTNIWNAATSILALNGVGWMFWGILFQSNGDSEANQDIYGGNSRYDYYIVNGCFCISLKNLGIALAIGIIRCLGNYCFTNNTR